MKTLSIFVLLSANLITLNGLAEGCTTNWCQTSQVKLNPTEQIICQHPDLQTADQLLNQIYQNYRKTLQGTAQKKLVASQRKWRVEERDLLSDKHEIMASILERIMELNFMSSVVNNP